MTGVIDCAVLLHTARENWLDTWMSGCFGNHARLRLHTYELAQTSDGLPSVTALRDASLPLRRYDVAILPVSYASLSWTRTALAGVGSQHPLSVPLMALVEELRAPAIQDLFELGVTDFLRRDDSLDDLRVRLVKMAYTRGPSMHGLCKDAGENSAAAPYADIDSPPSPAPDVLEEASHGSDETFRTAKTRVVTCFERAYVARALSRHAGNISMAARSAQKHRRAFWALMRKHHIDAAQYRSADCGIQTQSAAN